MVSTVFAVQVIRCRTSEAGEGRTATGAPVERFMSKIIVAVLFCLAISGVASADTIWSNGTPLQDSFWCNDCFRAGVAEGWVPYDNFKLSSPSTVTGFSFVSDIIFGAVYNDTKWYLWDAQPVTSAVIGAPIASGVATAIPNCGGTPPTVTGDECAQGFAIAALNLAPGTYWVGFANQFNSSTYSSIFNSSGSPLPGGDGQINWITQTPNGDYRSSGDFAFTVEGSVHPVTPSVPEPSTISLLCSGLIAIGGALRGRLTK